MAQPDKLPQAQQPQQKAATESNPEQSVAELRAQLAAKDAQIAKLGGGNLDQDVRRRMAAGLDREAAIACSRRQKAYDATLKQEYPDETARREAQIEAGGLS